MSNNFNQNRINLIGPYLKEKFGHKVIKLSLEGGFTCPNRDGTKGEGGCIFCAANGTGHFASDIPGQIRLLSEKWHDPDARYIAYFQNGTNTYAPISVLQGKYYDALHHKGVVGLAIATRPDCIDDEVMELLYEINRSTFLWVELGLQSIHKKTADFINRCYDLEVYDEAISRLNAAGIKVVTHLILGLPGESREEMMESVKYACDAGTWGLKLHMLNVVRGSRMGMEMPDYVPFQSIEEYAGLVIDILRRTPEEIVMHRLSADAPRPILISPKWSYKKRTILNTIHNTMREMDVRQGDLV